MRKITMQDKTFKLTEDIDLVYEKTITKYGTGAKIDAPKKLLGRKLCRKRKMRTLKRLNLNRKNIL